MYLFSSLSTRIPLGVVLALLLFSFPGLATDDPEPQPKVVFDAEQIEKVLGLFTATEKTLTPDGRLRLVYRFDSLDDTLSDDWLPSIYTTKLIRWSKRYEGSAEGTRGIILSGSSGWHHKALFEKEVSLEAEYTSISASKGDIVATVYTYRKGKASVGTSMGKQLIRFANLRPAGADPKIAPDIMYGEHVRFGFTLKDGAFTALRSGGKTRSTSSPKFLKKLGSGQVGFVWKGQISGFISETTIEGKLDLEWVEKQIPGVTKKKKSEKKES